METTQAGVEKLLKSGQIAAAFGGVTEVAKTTPDAFVAFAVATIQGVSGQENVKLTDKSSVKKAVLDNLATAAILEQVPPTGNTETDGAVKAKRADAERTGLMLLGRACDVDSIVDMAPEIQKIIAPSRAVAKEMPGLAKDTLFGKVSDTLFKAADTGGKRIGALAVQNRQAEAAKWHEVMTVIKPHTADRDFREYADLFEGLGGGSTGSAHAPAFA